MEEDGRKVLLNVYDLSQGLARQLSTTFLGKAIEAIWHTGVVVYGNEYYFGGGIQHSPAGGTQYGKPIRVIDIGITHVPKEIFEDFLQEISPRYTAETYRLLSHNCNNFSNEVAQFLVGSTIPDYILQLPNDVINSPRGALMLQMILPLETTFRSGAVPQGSQFRPPSSASQPSAPRSIISSPENGNSNIVETTTALENNMPQVIDPLGAARSRVKEEITREFAAIMATGTVRASEAAVLATRKVMERLGRLNVAMQQA